MTEELAILFKVVRQTEDRSDSEKARRWGAIRREIDRLADRLDKAQDYETRSALIDEAARSIDDLPARASQPSAAPGASAEVVKAARSVVHRRNEAGTHTLGLLIDRLETALEGSPGHGR